MIDSSEYRAELHDQVMDKAILCKHWDGDFDRYLPDAELTDDDINAAVSALGQASLLEEVETGNGKLPLCGSKSQDKLSSGSLGTLIEINAVLQTFKLKTDGQLHAS
ncbi:hypothetical protein FRB90_012077 [Tulasnella sp. 427]|nr:hypothetical protein FRB90_012077 [Tulasnella sp. 427]